MSVAAPRQVLHRCRLAPDAQYALDRLVAERGVRGAARALDVSCITVEKFRFGGCGSHDAAEVLAERLAGVVR